MGKAGSEIVSWKSRLLCFLRFSPKERKRRRRNKKETDRQKEREREKRENRVAESGVLVKKYCQAFDSQASRVPFFFQLPLLSAQKVPPFANNCQPRYLREGHCRHPFRTRTKRLSSLPCRPMEKGWTSRASCREFRPNKCGL